MALVGGCVEQTMTIKSDPPGALVYLNDQEVGRTPLKRDFIWYGNYQVEVRKEGYETLKTHKWITAPIYGWVPLDLFAQLQPFTLTDAKPKRTRRPITDPQQVERRRAALAKARAARTEKIAAAREGAGAEA